MISYSCFVQNSLDKGNGIKLMPLIIHGGTPGAGCFIQDKSDKVYGQLYAEEVYFNINNKEEIYKKIDNTTYPKGYTYGFTNRIYVIFIKEIPIKKEGCLTTAKYKILIACSGILFGIKYIYVAT